MNRIIKLKETKEFAYYITAINQEQYTTLKIEMDKVVKSKIDKLLPNFNINVTDIEAMGDSDVTEAFAKDYIEFRKVRNADSKFDNAQWGRGKDIISAKCYALNIENKNVVIHYDCLSSWKCLMDTMGQPKLLLIYKQKI